MGTNKTRWKTMDRLAQDPRVEEIWDEGADGIWVSLKPGWNAEGCSCVHGWTVGETLQLFRDLVEEGPTY